MTTQTGRAFNEWLRAQLKAKKMSQRQLAQQSGVDHSTISRLIRGDRMPSLGTATALARGLREIREDADTAQYLGLVTSGPQNPTARVEYALRADDTLSESQVRQIMEYYLAVRVRRFGRTFHPADQLAAGTHGNGNGSHADGTTNAHAALATNPEPMTTGGRPLGFAHLPARSNSMGTSPGRASRVASAARVSTAPTITRPPGRSSDRY